MTQLQTNKTCWLVTHLVLRQPTSNFRPGGQSILTFPKRLLKDLKERGIDPAFTINEIFTTAQDRAIWKTYL